MPSKLSPNSASRPSGWTDVRPNAQARRWVGWGALAAVGLLLAVVGGMGAQKEKSRIARTTLVVSEVQSGIQAMGMEALMAAQGNPGSIDNLRSWRSKVGVAMTLLEKGGYAAPSDPTAVFSLPNDKGVSLEPLRQALANMDTKIRPLEESAAQLRDAATAEDALAQSLASISRALGNMERTPQLSGGSWGSALASSKAVLSRPEMKTMQVIFAPLPGAETLQNSWSQQFVQLNQQLTPLAAAAEKDTGLSSAARTQVKALTAAVAQLAGASTTLANTLQARLAAKGLQGPIQESIAAIQAPISELGTDVVSIQSSRPAIEYIGWIGSLMALVGLCGLIVAAWALGRDHYVAAHESKSGIGVIEAVDRMTRTLRRIQTADGSYTGSGRLEESPDSPTFALSAMVNRLMEQMQEQQERRATSVDALLALLAEITNRNVRVNGFGTTLVNHSNVASGLATSLAQELASLSQGTSSQSLQPLVELSANLELLMEEGGSKMDQSRSNIQNASKLLKRFAEGAQQIAQATNVIDGISRQVKVLSTNTAIAAASLGGDAGRRFAVLANETERLSNLAHETASGVAQEVQALQVDAQEAVMAMEQSTAGVVASGEISGRAAATIRELERGLGTVAKGRETTVRHLEKQAVVSIRLSKGCDESSEASKQLLEEDRGLTQDLEQLKGLVRQMKG